MKIEEVDVLVGVTGGESHYHVREKANSMLMASLDQIRQVC
jgi:hypothetical protein